MANRVKQAPPPEPVLQVKNKLATVHNPARAAELFARILRAVRQAEARKRQEAERNGCSAT